MCHQNSVPKKRVPDPFAPGEVIHRGYRQTCDLYRQVRHTCLIEGIEVSCSKSDWQDIWVNKDKKNSFGELIGESNVYGRKLELRTILKAKQDILEQLLTEPTMQELSDIKSAFQNYAPKKKFKDDVLDTFDIKIFDLKTKGSSKTAKNYTTTARNIFKHCDGKKLRFPEITKDWLENYERIRLKTVKKASVAIDLRNLRTIANFLSSIH